MAVTFSLTLFSSYDESFGRVMQSLTCMITSIVTALLLLIPLIIFRKSVPVNYILLFAFTICESFMISALTAGLTIESVFLSEAVTVATLVGLFGGAIFCSSDVKLLVCLIIGLVVTLIAQSVAMITLACMGYISNSWFVCYALCGAIGAGIYIMVDLLYIMIPGAMDLDDYIMGSLMLYVDIIRMFIYILALFGKGK